MNLVYDELRVVARHHLYKERPDHTLETKALVHEAMPWGGNDALGGGTHGRARRPAPTATACVLAA